MHKVKLLYRLIYIIDTYIYAASTRCGPHSTLWMKLKYFQLKTLWIWNFTLQTEREREIDKEGKRNEILAPLFTGLRCNITLFKCARNLLAMIAPLRQCLNWIYVQWGTKEISRDLGGVCMAKGGYVCPLLVWEFIRFRGNTVWRPGFSSVLNLDTFNSFLIL